VSERQPDIARLDAGGWVLDVPFGCSDCHDAMSEVAPPISSGSSMPSASAGAGFGEHRSARPNDAVEVLDVRSERHVGRVWRDSAGA